MNQGHEAFWRLVDLFGYPGRPLPQQTKAQLIGGPYDGELVDCRHYIRRQFDPQALAVQYVPEAEIPPMAVEPRVREHRLVKYVYCYDAAPVKLYIDTTHELGQHV